VVDVQRIPSIVLLFYVAVEGQVSPVVSFDEAFLALATGAS